MPIKHTHGHFTLRSRVSVNEHTHSDAAVLPMNMRWITSLQLLCFVSPFGDRLVCACVCVHASTASTSTCSHRSIHPLPTHTQVYLAGSVFSEGGQRPGAEPPSFGALGADDTSLRARLEGSDWDEGGRPSQADVEHILVSVHWVGGKHVLRQRSTALNAHLALLFGLRFLFSAAHASSSPTFVLSDGQHPQ